MALLPDISWEVTVRNVSVHITAFNYVCEVEAENPNNPGYNQLAVGYYLIDFTGHVYEVMEIVSATDNRIRVYDVYETVNGNGPYINRTGFIYEAKNGAIILTQAQLRRLDESAPDNIQPVEKGVIWDYRGIQLGTEDRITKINLGANLTTATVTNNGWQGGKEITLNASGGSLTETDPIWISEKTNYYTKTNMQTSGQASLHWDNLTNVPSLGEANTASNLGTGEGLFTTKSGINLPFKSIKAGINVTLSSTSTELTISATAGAAVPGGSNTQIQYNSSGSFAGNSSMIYGTILGGEVPTSGLVCDNVLITDSLRVGDTADNAIVIASSLNSGQINHIATGSVIDLGTKGASDSVDIPGNLFVSGTTSVSTIGVTDYPLIALSTDDVKTFQGPSGSFTTVDGKTVTVVNGLVTSIV